jgi:hypothetical protein
VRHGTAILLAALDLHGGGIFTATDLARNTAANFIDFLDDLDTRCPPALEVHLYWTTAPRTSPTRPASGLSTIPASTRTTP